MAHNSLCLFVFPENTTQHAPALVRYKPYWCVSVYVHVRVYVNALWARCIYPFELLHTLREEFRR